MPNSPPRYQDYHATSQPMAAMEADYASGASTGWHAHPRGQLLYAIEGVMIVRSAAGSWVVPPNRAVWLVPDLTHEVRMSGAVKIRTLFIRPDAAPHLPRASCVIAVSSLLRELIIAAMLVPLDYRPDTRDERLMRLILDELRETSVLPLHLPMPQDARLRQICAALIADPSDARTAEDWARPFAVTAKTIYRLFMQETGLSFAQWRQQARLLFALERLAQGARILDVALDSGYASQSAFTAMFRRHFGMPPGVFYR
ncbi:helix-turn-helix transcriptional regulator [Acidisoma cellulosilytica]|uniref:Helix-turn-helix transcriptional regulator n=1 Tax=Acidisoma cellulosilyticum TaxID=2802395 RepID=A0A963Z3K4_9PROT|nr:helix-turn-helix transcriptional regulator [Acidisoma cellulosilyticum]MCB8881919.1 helix-turn-helix transcriptional regulator [Acidisoma cellulosilyticum]